MADETLKER